MLRTWKIGRVADIDLAVHWSFLVLLALIVLSAAAGGMSVFGIASQLAVVLAAFTCVVLHELGHALAAKAVGIKTHGIVLLPIGGVAQLESIPRNPWHELFIALAGPAVNVLIVLLLLPLVGTRWGLELIAPVSVFGGAFLGRLLAFNVVMILFNLLPAFPMDGGRVLRAMLALKGPYYVATDWAVRVGQLMAVVFVVAGFFINPMLLLVAAFVYYAGQQELQLLRREMRMQDAWSEPLHDAGPGAASIPRPIVVLVHTDG